MFKEITKKQKISIGVLALLVTIAYFFILPYYRFLTDTLRIQPFHALFFDDSVKKIDGSVNILILGIGGGTHEGPNLTDSIIVANYDFDTDRLTTIGIPRDIWSDTLRDKINTAYAYGEAKQEDGGLKLAKAEVGAIIGMPIQYSVVISFNRFKDLIDYLGGIDIHVEKSFTDNKFPIEGKENDQCNGDPEYGCRYETVTFKKGLIHMDGQTALKFVRSRHAEGEEGTDFSRSRRQQLVIAAIKDKALKIGQQYDLEKFQKLYSKADSLVNRDVTNQELVSIGKDIVFSSKYTQKNLFLPEEVFIVPHYEQYDGKYVLVPAKNWDTIHAFVQCLISRQDQEGCLASVNK